MQQGTAQSGKVMTAKLQFPTQTGHKPSKQIDIRNQKQQQQR
jgi:hypothetical protein